MKLQHLTEDLSGFKKSLLSICNELEISKPTFPESDELTAIEVPLAIKLHNESRQTNFSRALNIVDNSRLISKLESSLEQLEELESEHASSAWYLKTPRVKKYHEDLKTMLAEAKAHEQASELQGDVAYALNNINDFANGFEEEADEYQRSLAERFMKQYGLKVYSR